MRWDFWRKKPSEPSRPEEPEDDRELEPSEPILASWQEPPPLQGPIHVETSGADVSRSEAFNHLLKERAVFVGSQIDDEVAGDVIAHLLFLQREDPGADIHLYIDSPGGSVVASLAIFDAIRFVRNDVATFCVGAAEGTALLLLAAGEKGKRSLAPNVQVGFADVWSPLEDGDDYEEEEKLRKVETARLRQCLIDAFHASAGLSKERVASEIGAGRHFGAEDAIRMGLADRAIALVPRTP